MATPTCPKCGGTRMEIQEIAVQHANYRHNCINCQSCGAIVAVEERLSMTYMLGKLAEKLGVRFDS